MIYVGLQAAALRLARDKPDGTPDVFRTSNGDLGTASVIEVDGELLPARLGRSYDASGRPKERAQFRELAGAELVELRGRAIKLDLHGQEIA